MHTKTENTDNTAGKASVVINKGKSVSKDFVLIETTDKYFLI